MTDERPKFSLLEDLQDLDRKLVRLIARRVEILQKLSAHRPKSPRAAARFASEEKELKTENTLASEVVAKSEILSASEKVAETGTLSTGEIVAEDETVVVQGNDLKSEMPSTNENATKTEILLQGVTKTAFESGNECATKPETLLQTASVENPVTVETNLANGETLTAQSQSVNAGSQGLKDVSGELK